MKQFLKYLLVGGVVMAGCSDDSERLSDKDYFPIQKNLYWIYDVNGVQYKLGNATEFYYQLKVEVVDSFPNQAASYTYVLHRSKRADENANWEFMESWSTRIATSELIITEGNIPVIHLAFPAKKGRRWDSNFYNTLDADDYLIQEAGVTYNLNNGQSFDDAVVVLQEDFLTLINRDQRKEVFARGVGLIYKEMNVVEFDQNGEKTPQDGMEYVQRLLEFGR